MIPWALTCLVAMTAAEPELPTTTVGMPGRIEQLVLPGGLLEAKPLTDRRAPVVLRVTAAYPHGNAHRYDLEYYALEPGEHDLSDYLQPVDGSRHQDVPAIPVHVRSMLPDGQIQPHELKPKRVTAVGGYRAWLVAGGIVWGAGLLAILLAGRHRRRGRPSAAERSVTLKERLEEAIRAARQEGLDAAQRAELERMVLAHWRRRLALDHVEAAEAMSIMRDHADARAALDQLEHWLHDPTGRVPEDFRQLVGADGVASGDESIDGTKRSG